MLLSISLTAFASVVCPGVQMVEKRNLSMAEIETPESRADTNAAMGGRRRLSISFWKHLYKSGSSRMSLTVSGWNHRYFFFNRLGSTLHFKSQMKKTVSSMTPPPSSSAMPAIALNILRLSPRFCRLRASSLAASV